jgi:hypothetical protein
MARLTADDQELARRELQDEAVQSGATAVTSCMRGEPVCVAGTLRAVTLRPARARRRSRPSCSTGPGP